MTVWNKQSFIISHVDSSEFEGKGLRPFFEYRDLGISTATGGNVVAHVIRAVPNMESEALWHTHDLDFQLVYVTKGWVVFEYDGPEGTGGEHKLVEGCAATTWHSSSRSSAFE